MESPCAASQRKWRMVTIQAAGRAWKDERWGQMDEQKYQSGRTIGINHRGWVTHTYTDSHGVDTVGGTLSRSTPDVYKVNKQKQLWISKLNDCVTIQISKGRKGRRDYICNKYIGSSAADDTPVASPPIQPFAFAAKPGPPPPLPDVDCPI